MADAPVSLRLANAVVAYAKYFIATFWPHDLAVYYPFPPEGIPPAQVVGALLLLGALTVLAFVTARTVPCLVVGWLWFLGTLVPVVGLVQVGGQAMADRYHYIPSIGLFLALTYGAAEWLARSRIGRIPVAVGCALLLAGSASLTAAQVARWRDSETLFTHTLAVTPPNLVIEFDLGHALGWQRRYAEALPHFENALRIKPDFFDALLNMGITLAALDRPAEAVDFLERALRAEPSSSKAHAQLALAFVRLDRKDEALREFHHAVELDPQNADARTNLGLMLARQGNAADALAELTEAVRLDPNNAQAHNNLGLVLLARGQARESIPHFETALRLQPDLAVARENLARAQAQIR